MTLEERCQAIELILADVDGVLTDGAIVFDNQGIETKRFYVRDGLGVKLWQRAGGKFGLVTARSSHIVKLRAVEMGVEIVRQGSDEKRAISEQVLAELELQPRQLCYIGDDLPDLAAIQYAGLGVAVADATADVRAAAHFVTLARGGYGAVRETIELILKAQHRWDDLIQKFRMTE
jgi:3-deoxy-D-manno-octulosonate 8-phosphate phosphatase (KDO 8-P phosphatase)